MIILFKFVIINDSTDKLLIKSSMTDISEILPGSDHIFVVKDIGKKTAVRIIIDKFTESNFLISIDQVKPISINQDQIYEENSPEIQQNNYQLILKSITEQILKVTIHTSKLKLDSKVLNKNNPIIIPTTQKELLGIQIIGDQIVINKI